MLAMERTPALCLEKPRKQSRVTINEMQHGKKISRKAGTRLEAKVENGGFAGKADPRAPA